ncbi:MAG: DMT family transporter [Proteobacteria bacterium]|nr:DMT family transporter [Pseudomonadota bacterium]
MRQQNKPILGAVLALLVLALLWSYNWIVTKSVLCYVGALDFTALRCAFGSLVLLVLLPLTGRPLKPPPWQPVLWVALFQTVGMTGLSQLALISGGAGKTAVLVYTMPFWVILLAVLFLGEKPRWSQGIAAAIAALGLLLVVQPWQWHGSLSSSLLAAASGASWAASTIAAKRAFRHQGVDLLNLVTWQMVAGTVVLSALAIVTHSTPIVWSWPMLLALGYNGVLATALGWTLWLFILRTLPTGVAGISTLMIPVLSVLWAWWLLDERPNHAEAGGIGLILLALALLAAPSVRAGRQRPGMQDEQDDEPPRS